VDEALIACMTHERIDQSLVLNRLQTLAKQRKLGVERATLPIRESDRDCVFARGTTVSGWTRAGRLEVVLAHDDADRIVAAIAVARSHVADELAIDHGDVADATRVDTATPA
jgi:hypothetical protein